MSFPCTKCTDPPCDDFVEGGVVSTSCNRGTCGHDMQAHGMTSAAKHAGTPAANIDVPHAVVAAAPPPQNAPDWQKHCWWCACSDPGSSGFAYHNTGGDYYDRVWACQTDAGNGGALQQIEGAGRDAVNAYCAGLGCG